MSDKAARRHPQARKRRGRQPLVGRRASGVVPAPTCTTPAISSSGSPAEIYALFDPDLSGGRFGPLDPFVVRTALTLLTRIVGLPLAAIDLAPPLFSFGSRSTSRRRKRGRSSARRCPRYHSWRRIILDAQMLATRGSVDQDPWDGLRRVARLTMGRSASEALRAAERHFPGTAPAGLTLARADRGRGGPPSGLAAGAFERRSGSSRTFTITTSRSRPVSCRHASAHSRHAPASRTTCHCPRAWLPPSPTSRPPRACRPPTAGPSRSGLA